jgi:hypothetical protein
VIAAPPLSAGRFQVTITELFPARSRTLRGELEMSAGVTLFELAEAGPLPPAVMAATRKEYRVPFVSPLTVHVRSDVVHVKPPGLLVTR